ncbi:hypothetical protein BGZ51_007069 [Haplosporangium sp. Z 767]|nr:hypothetical protein BGZ50_004934 [Haplosporangium sp. Z 11]KAF9194849.1 hypothetical protein BGZ51_007069 [Haplosporangium sp. Z 767]
MSTELRLQRQLDHNKRLREQYDRERISVSQASELLIEYCRARRDMFLPTVWGEVDKKDDPFEIQPAGCGCIIM